MKKFLALLMAAMMLFSFAAFAEEEEAGFDEFDLGVEGEQELGEEGSKWITASMVYFQPVDMWPADMAPAKEDSDLHIEVDLFCSAENPYGFAVDMWIPDLNIDYVITNTKTGEKYDGTMMQMNASDGQHYGNNIALPEGSYEITISIRHPENYLLHVDAETGPGADSFWLEPYTATWTGWEFVKQW